MGVPFQTSDHDYCLVPPKSTQSSGMLEIEELEIFLIEEIMCKISQKKFSEGGTTRSRSICFLVVEPTPSILLLVIRSKQFSCRCTRTKVVTWTSLCLTPICIDTKGIKKIKVGTCPFFFDASNTNLASQTL